jgi:hypothetical protein
MTVMKLNASTRRFLKALKHDPSSRGSFMYIPFSGPYWEDEGAKDLHQLTRVAKHEVIALFGSRIKKWSGQALSKEEQDLWDQCLAEFPECPIFKRMEATLEIMNDLKECAEGTMEFFESFGEVTEVDVEKGEYGLVELTRHPKPLGAPKPTEPKGR